MRFLVDSMLPPAVADALREAGHDAITPMAIGAHNLPDDFLIEFASEENWVIVTENAADFAHASTCVVLLVRKAWWPRESLAAGMTAAIDRWSLSNPEPGTWAHWLEAEFR